ncbi:MAG: TonB family protein [Gemmatimonadota bacterium]|nr:TonB family protein [Gemmatimonadota bacterium]
MLARLLESKKSGERSLWGALASTIAHTGVIAVAVFATAHARVEERPPTQVVQWLRPPTPQPAVVSAAAIPPRQPTELRPRLETPAALAIDRIDVVIPALDPTAPLSVADPLPPAGGQETPGPAAPSGVGAASTEPFLADQVERQVYPRPGNRPPRYPRALQSAGIEGRLVALFVVNEAGRVELSSVRFTQSDSSQFEAAVRDALAGMRFGPAEVGGKKVRQLVQMPFVFSLNR